MALALEETMEQRIGEVCQKFQDAKVEVLTAGQVEKWQPRWRVDQPYTNVKVEAMDRTRYYY